MPAGGAVHTVRQFVHEDELASLYGWLDEVPLSRPKRNITRDFADGVMAAEVIAHFLPRIIETHNYQPCAGKSQKRGNWDTLNKKVLKRVFKMHVPDNVVDAIIAMRPGVVEVVMIHIRNAIDAYLGKHAMHKTIEGTVPTGTLPPHRNGAQPIVSDPPKATTPTVRLDDPPSPRGSIRRANPTGRGGGGAGEGDQQSTSPTRKGRGGGGRRGNKATNALRPEHSTSAHARIGSERKAKLPPIK
eukprot:m.125646 g.125646  ORF g.125646 m.125646 type:complete len:244 (+) comp11173_c0_seq2:382-1113(+)